MVKKIYSRELSLQNFDLCMNKFIIYMYHTCIIIIYRYSHTLLKFLKTRTAQVSFPIFGLPHNQIYQKVRKKTVFLNFPAHNLCFSRKMLKTTSTAQPKKANFATAQVSLYFIVKYARQLRSVPSFEGK